MTGIFRKNVSRRELALGTGAALSGLLSLDVGAVKTTVKDKLNIDITTVTDVGMLTSNNAAQNTNAIGLALVSNSKHATLVIPAGTFQLMPEINLGIYKRIIGAGRDQTILQFDVNTGTAAFLIDQYCSIEGVTIQNTGSNTTTSAACCSYSPGTGNGWANGVLKDCRIMNFGYGVSSSVTFPSVSPYVTTLTRSQCFSLKIWNNIFYRCGIPIYLGVGANALSIKGNSFGVINGETMGNRNIVLNSCLQTTIEPDNVFQGCASGGFDIEMTGCISAKVGGYFELAYGIYADSCPGLAVDQCILNGFAASKTAFVVTTNASNAGSWNYPLPIKSSVENITLFSSGAGKFCVQNAATSANVMTLTDNISSQGNDWTINGLASYPKFAEGNWAPVITAGTSGTFTMSQQSGRYQQRGKQITAEFQAAFSASNAPVGTVNIGGLPANIANISPGGIAYAPTVALSGWGPITTTGTFSAIGLQGVKNTATMKAVKSSIAGATLAELTCAELGSFGQFNGAINYEVD